MSSRADVPPEADASWERTSLCATFPWVEFSKASVVVGWVVIVVDVVGIVLGRMVSL